MKLSLQAMSVDAIAKAVAIFFNFILFVFLE